MAKKKKFKGLYDSPEEWHFSLWLEQLRKTGYVKDYIAHPEPYSLFDEVKVDYYTPYVNKPGGKYSKEALLRSHSYGPDYKIIWEEKAKDIFFTLQDSQIRKKKGHAFIFILAYEDGFGNSISIVEIKPAFDRHNMTVVARMHQQMVYDKYSIYINILTPFKHFAKTFTPDRYFYTDVDDSTRPRTMKHKPAIDLTTFIAQKRKENGFNSIL